MAKLNDWCVLEIMAGDCKGDYYPVKRGEVNFKACEDNFFLYETVNGNVVRIVEVWERISDRQAELMWQTWLGGREYGYRRAKKDTAKSLINKLHAAYSCDPTDDWSQGFDEAISLAIGEVEKVTSCRFEDVFEEVE